MSDAYQPSVIEAKWTPAVATAASARYGRALGAAAVLQPDDVSPTPAPRGCTSATSSHSSGRTFTAASCGREVMTCSSRWAWTRLACTRRTTP